MDYQIVLQPELNLSPGDVVEAWNGMPECQKVAKAHLTESTSTQCSLFAAAGVALSSVALGVISNTLFDLIKKVFVKKGVTKQTEIIQLDQPDGSRLLVVKIIEFEQK